MSILKGLFFGSQLPFYEVSMNCREYYRAGNKADKCKAIILEQYPNLEQFMKNTLTRKRNRPNSEDFTISRWKYTWERGLFLKC